MTLLPTLIIQPCCRVALTRRVARRSTAADRGRIHRRLFAADSADFTSRIFFATCLDYLDLLMQSLLAWTRPAPPPPDKEPDGHGS